MVPMFFILGVIAWVILAFWPATWARRKGYSFVLFLIISLLISWLVALIIVLFLKDKTATPESIAAERAVDEVMEEEQQNSSAV